MNNELRILSLDGGGIRGLIQISAIKRLEEKTGFLSKINLFTGTSTGGLISLALAAGISPAVIKSIYLDEGKKIFSDSWLDDIKDLLGLTGADYDLENLESVLKKVFGELKMKDLKRPVIVTAFDLDNESLQKDKRTWEPVLFSNIPANNKTSEVLVYKAALYTAAAPTYFPSVDGYVDGGIFAANPSAQALCYAQSVLGVPVSGCKLLSIGSGASLKYIEGMKNDWGYLQYLNPLLSMMFDGQIQSADLQCRELLRERYFRVAPVFPEEKRIPMDDVSNLDYMNEFAEKIDLSEAEKWIKEELG